MGLAALPKAFGIAEVAKGYFPHFFNKIENQNYIGQLPPRETFGIRAMTKEKQKEFDDWYDEHAEGPPFDLKKGNGNLLCIRCRIT